MKKTPEKERIGREIAAGRKRLSMNQGELAAALGVSVSAVSKWESGNQSPTGDIFIRVVKLLGLNDLLEKEDEDGIYLVFAGWLQSSPPDDGGWNDFIVRLPKLEVAKIFVRALIKGGYDWAHAVSLSQGEIVFLSYKGEERLPQSTS